MRSEDIAVIKKEIREFKVEEFIEGDRDPVPFDVVCIRAMPMKPRGLDNRCVPDVASRYLLRPHMLACLKRLLDS